MLTKIIKVLISILIVVLVVDPGDLIFHLKVPLFILIFLVWFVLKTTAPIRLKSDIIINCVLFLMIPLFGISVAVLQDNFDDPTFAIGFVKSFLVLLLIVITYDLKLDLSPYLLKCCFLIPLIIIPIYILVTINVNNIIQINQFVTDKDVAKFSFRGYYGYKVLMLYYRTSPLLVFPLAYYCYRFFYVKASVINLIFVAIFFFTLFLSGTRANILSAVAVVAYMVFKFLNKKKNKVPLVLASTVLIFFAILFIGSLSFKTEDKSSQVKSGHLDSYIEHFTAHPQYLLWGSGMGSKFYSSGNGFDVSQTELTYFDLVRWFGLPLASILMFLIFYPVIYLHQNKLLNDEKRAIILGYYLYLFIAGTNPLLVSSTGMIAIVTLYSLMNSKRDIYSKSLAIQRIEK